MHDRSCLMATRPMRLVDGVVVVRPRAAESFVPEPSIEVTAGAFGGVD